MKQAQWKEIVIGLLSVTILVLLEATSGVSTLQHVFAPVFVPLSERIVRLSRIVTIPLHPLTQWYEPQQRVRQLTEQLAQAEGVIAELGQLQAENAQLRGLLENRHLQVKPRRLARPIVSSITPLVWLGEASEVQPGWLVLYKDTVLGQVAAVNGQYARVNLLTTSGSITILVQTEHGVKGIAKADNGRVVVLNIAPDELIELGDRITTVGQPGVAPGKFIGLVTAVERDPQTAVQTLVLDQLVSFYQTSVVEIEE